MKAIQLPGYGDKWLVDLEYSPWSPILRVLRSEGLDGTTVTFKTQAEAEARIAELKAEGVQGIIDHHKPQPGRKGKQGA